MVAPSRILRRSVAVVVGLLFAVVLVLLAEGASSLWRGRSLLRRAIEPSARLADGFDDQQRARFANLTPGPFDVDTDPEVGHRVKAQNAHAWVGVPATTDSFGMRVRPGGWPEDERPRWVVLGDSVAFGYGVADDQNLAARLEQLLTAHWPGPGPAPAVLTVAAPGWNLESAARYLRNHLHRYRPSLVVWVPVDNDLDSRFVPNGAGGRGYGIDPVFGLTRQSLSGEAYTDLRVAMSAKAPLDRLTAVLADGGLLAVEHALTAGLAPWSKRRYDEVVQAVCMLQRELAARQCALVMAGTWDTHFHRELQERLAVAAPGLPFTCLLDEWREVDALVGDGHANAACIEATARHLLRFLAERGLTKIAAAAEPAAAYADRLLAPWSAPQREAFLRRRQALLAKYSGARIDLRDGFGFQQIYGGVEPDGTIGGSATFALRGEGASASLELVLQAPAGAAMPPGLRLAITCDDGALAGPVGESVVVPTPESADAIVTLRIPLPAALRTDGWFDVRLQLSDHVVETIGGRSRLASLRLIVAALLP
ncbi:MAG: hypothetical protein K8J09_05760 [Planctomycetes bacterium]|nr:hypothetical protein [Planctomycetota bacterium]MCC7397899.1 hypothetical protein [Planctomycetota bacterium]